jgi:Outer membrane protein beta-barrel domain
VLKKIFHFLFCLLVVSSVGFAQKVKTINSPNYDYKQLHFGFLLGINKADFIIHPTANLAGLDSVYVLESSPQSGFNLGIVSNLRLNDYMDLRFIPALSFSTRNLEYTFKSTKGDIKRTKPIESTFVQFPLDLKLKSARLNNFRAYLVVGGKYSIDIASQKDVNSSLISDAIVKLSKNDIYYSVGVGFDFYQRYFKFSPELKFNFGLRNLLVRDNNVFSKSIDKITSKIIDISFTFE